MKSLVDKFYGIVDGYYSGSDDFKDVEEALMLRHQYEQTLQQIAEYRVYGSIYSAFDRLQEIARTALPGELQR